MYTVKKCVGIAIGATFLFSSLLLAQAGPGEGGDDGVDCERHYVVLGPSVLSCTTFCVYYVTPEGGTGVRDCCGGRVTLHMDLQPEHIQICQ